MWWEALLRNRPVVLTHPDPNILGCLLEVSGGGGHVYHPVVMPMKVFLSNSIHACSIQYPRA